MGAFKTFDVASVVVRASKPLVGPIEVIVPPSICLETPKVLVKLVPFPVDTTDGDKFRIFVEVLNGIVSETASTG